MHYKGFYLTDANSFAVCDISWTLVSRTFYLSPSAWRPADSYMVSCGVAPFFLSRDRRSPDFELLNHITSLLAEKHVKFSCRRQPWRVCWAPRWGFSYCFFFHTICCIYPLRSVSPSFCNPFVVGAVARHFIICVTRSQVTGDAVGLSVGLRPPGIFFLSRRHYCEIVDCTACCILFIFYFLSVRLMLNISYFFFHVWITACSFFSFFLFFVLPLKSSETYYLKLMTRFTT